MEVPSKPHVLCIPFPTQSHIKAMLKFAKLLHFRGFQITFVNTVFNHNRFLKSLGPNSLDGFTDFKFEAIPDGLPPSNEDATQDIPSLVVSMTSNVLSPFLDLVTTKLASNVDIPPVTAIVSDLFVNCFTITAAEQLGIPMVLFSSIAACRLMAFMQYSALVEKGLTPLIGEYERN